MTKKTPRLTKPDVDFEKALEFAKSDQKEDKSGTSGYPRKGDVRLNVNVEKELHFRLKIEAVRQGTTVTKLIKELIEKYIPR